ncbi:MAG TPA: hypothetical protein VI793_04190 [Anaerolineales bacterium]|nr:hypothetical protein [Anaerolineales bacterium]
MIKIADLIGMLSNYLEAQRQLDQCRRRATGNVEYYSYGYIQDLKLAEKDLEQALNGYIDQRVAEKIEHLNTRPA